MLEYRHMSEIYAVNPFELNRDPSVEELFDTLLAVEPKPIGNFVPTNAAEQKDLFFDGTIRNPDHQYDKLSAIDFEANRTEILDVTNQLVDHEDTPLKYKDTYVNFGQNYLNKTIYMEKVNQYKQAEDGETKDALRADLMKMNIELYGEPDEQTYRSILNEKLDVIKNKELSGEAATIRDELMGLVGDVETSNVERFHPSEETVAWMNEIAHSLYDGMLDHIPDEKTFEDAAIKAVFEDILLEEFGESAKGWKVDVEKAQSINVKAGEKRLVIPEGRKVSQAELRDLVVHELGVHFMRSVMGDQTDLLPLRLGLSEYYDTEEGLGVVMEQALAGEFKEAGLGHYLTAGLAHFDGKDFRDIFEIKWRLDALAKDDIETSDKALDKTKQATYKNTMRVMRGTDDMPWFKDLAYYNGAAETWKHLESIVGDDIEFMLVLLGKANPSNPSHRRIMLETATPSFADDPTEEEAAKV